MDDVNKAKHGRYHMRHPEKEITDEREILDIIGTAKYMTIAMCAGDDPYLCTLNFGFDCERKCFYFHCARTGKKIDILNRNPRVFGQVMIDDGYAVGRCDHAYRTVHFCGDAHIITVRAEKLRALECMVEKLEPEPDTLKQKLASGTPEKLDGVSVWRIDVKRWTGKRNAPGI